MEQANKAYSGLCKLGSLGFLISTIVQYKLLKETTNVAYRTSNISKQGTQKSVEDPRQKGYVDPVGVGGSVNSSGGIDEQTR